MAAEAPTSFPSFRPGLSGLPLGALLSPFARLVSEQRRRYACLARKVRRAMLHEVTHPGPLGRIRRIPTRCRSSSGAPRYALHAPGRVVAWAHWTRSQCRCSR